MTVVNSRCACCGRTVFIENREAYQRRMISGEAAICSSCRDRPEAEAERMILGRESENLRERILEMSRMDGDAVRLVAAQMDVDRRSAIQRETARQVAA